MYSSSVTFPQNIDGLTYVETMHTEPVRREYTFALYKNAAGKKYVCKLWAGKQKGKSWGDLVNEIAVYKAFGSISQATQQHLAEKFPSIRVPKLHSSHVTNTLIYMVTEFVEGIFLSETPSKPKAVKTYGEVMAFFQEVSKYSQFLKSVPLKRTPLELFGVFHIHALHSMARFPAQIPLILSSFPAFYAGMISTVIDRKVSFVHRDLGGYNNILVKDDHFTVIDYQLACLTHPLVEAANFVASRKKDQQFTEAFFESPLWKSIQKVPRDKAIFKALFLYATMLNVATDIPGEDLLSIPLVRRAVAL